MKIVKIGNIFKILEHFLKLSVNSKKTKLSKNKYPKSIKKSKFAIKIWTKNFKCCQKFSKKRQKKFINKMFQVHPKIGLSHSRRKHSGRSKSYKNYVLGKLNLLFSVNTIFLTFELTARFVNITERKKPKTYFTLFF